jgi:hypothetical protein
VRVLKLLLLLASQPVAPAIATVVRLLSAPEAAGAQKVKKLASSSFPACLGAGVARLVWLFVCVCVCSALRVCVMCASGGEHDCGSCRCCAPAAALRCHALSEAAWRSCTGHASQLIVALVLESAGCCFGAQ